MKNENKVYNEPEELFQESWFKELPWYKRAWIRFVIAFFQTISMH